MPLQEGCSDDIVAANIRELITSGYEPSQATAIAYDQCKGAFTDDEWLALLARIQGSKGRKARMGSFIKATSLDRFEAHLVRFGSPGDTDLDEEWFSDKTYFMRNNGYALKGRPVNYQHMMEPDFGALNMAVFDYEDEDDIGLFVEAQMNNRARYIDMLRELGRLKDIKIGDAQIKRKANLAVKTAGELISTVPLQMSMGADPAAFYVNDRTRHIDICGIVHGALTPTPADDHQPLVRFKSAMANVVDLTNERKTFIIGNVRTAKGEQVDETGLATGTSVDNVPGSATATYEDGQPDLGEKSRLAILTKPKTKSNKRKKESTPMNIEELMEKIAKQVEPILAELLDEIGMEPEKQEEEELLEEMLGKAEDDLPKEEEELKQVEEEDVEEIVKANLKKWLPDAVTAHLNKQAKDAAARKGLVADVIDNAKANAPAQSYKRQRGGYSQREGNPQQPPAPRITVEEEMKYAGLSAEQMALGLQIVHQVAFPHKMPRLLKLQDYIDTGLVSEGFIKSLAFKATDTIKSSAAYKARGPHDFAMARDHALMKSVMPWKADEQDAVAITNQGAEWAFIFYDTRLWERARYETELFDKMVARGMRTVDVTGKSMNVKLDTGSPTVYTAPEGQSVDATGRPEIVVQTTPFTTDEVEKNVKKHMLATSHTDELSEDSIINIMAFLDTDAVIAMAESLESVIINGDTTATAANINTTSVPGTGIQTPDYIAWDGIRHQYLVDFTARGNASGAGLQVTDYEDTLKLLDATVRTGKKRKEKCLFIVDDYTESATRTLPELMTRDVAGVDATIWTGEIPPQFGVEVYASGFLARSLATGFIHDTAGNNTKGSIACVHAPYWQYGRKRDVTVELQRYAQASSTVVVVSVRHILAVRSDNAASGTFNITV